MAESDGAAHRPVLTVIGEAVVDLVPNGEPGGYRARPGGSPFNVAVGLARLGHRTALMARLEDRSFGRMLRTHAAAEGIDLTSAPHANEPATLAIVSVDAQAQATYDFYHQGTADWQWTAAETAQVPAGTAVFHHGSVAAWTPPGDDHILAAARRLHQGGNVLVSYDPNVRPSLLGHPTLARPLIERSVATSHVVKASRDDVEWLYPGATLDHIAAHWTELGAHLVVITDGPHGAHAMPAGGRLVHRPGREVALVDTVGAGDAFTSGLLSALIRRGLHTPDLVTGATPAQLAAALDDAILVSALTCERAGADPPTALPRPHVPAHTPLSATDLDFKDPPTHTSGDAATPPPRITAAEPM